MVCSVQLGFTSSGNLNSLSSKCDRLLHFQYSSTSCFHGHVLLPKQSEKNVRGQRHSLVIPPLVRAVFLALCLNPVTLCTAIKFAALENGTLPRKKKSLSSLDRDNAIASNKTAIHCFVQWAAKIKLSSKIALLSAVSLSGVDAYSKNKCGNLNGRKFNSVAGLFMAVMHTIMWQSDWRVDDHESRRRKSLTFPASYCQSLPCF